MGVYPRHGMCNTRIYHIWDNMKSRCYNKNKPKYKNYGARGVEVCKEWRNNFEAFYDWAINNGYNDTLSLNRIDNDGNYEPKNCAWSTATEQMNNTSFNHRVTYKGETHTIAEWSRYLGINYSTLSKRINKYKWSVERALITPSKNNNLVYKKENMYE